MENQVAIIPPAERAALALKSSVIEAELRTLAASSADIVAVLDGAGRDQAHRIAMVLRGKRTSIKATGKEARDDATKFSKAIIAEEDRLVAIIEPEETRVLALRDGYDAEQARIEAEKVAKERARMEAHESNLAAIHRIPAKIAGATSDAILLELDRCAAYVPTEAWEEYATKAAAAYAEVSEQLEAMYKAALASEEAARAAAEAAEAERKRVAAEAEALAIQKAEQAAEAQRLAAQQAEITRQQEEAAATARAEEEKRQAAADAHAAEMKRQADELDAKRAAFEAEQRAAQQAKDDEAKRNADHEEALAMDAVWNEIVAQVEPVDTRPVITVELEQAPELPPVEQEALPTMRLGMISERLDFAVTAAMLSEYGFLPSGKDKAAVLYHEHQFKHIALALIANIESAIAKWESAN